MARLPFGDVECVCVTDMEHKLLEERSVKQQLENRLMQLEKENSVLDCDYKQAKHELQDLRSLKEKLTEEVHLSDCSSCLAYFCNMLRFLPIFSTLAHIFHTFQQ